MINAVKLTNAINKHESLMNKSMNNISSGTISTSDNPAGSVIASKMEGQINGLDMAVKNAQDGISLLQTADGSLESVHKMLQRMNELSVSAANGTYSDDDRKASNKEFQELIKQVSKVLEETSFNTKPLFNSGSKDGGNKFILQVGANKGQSIEIDFGKMDLDSLGLKGLDISTQEGASKAIDAVKNAIKNVSSNRTSIGAYTNRVEYTIDNLEKYSENLANAKSRITDTKMAKEYLKYSKEKILTETNTNLFKMYLDVRETNAKSLLTSFK